MRFFKLSGAGNDFVLIEKGPAPSGLPGLARRLCDRRSGIGADGLLVVGRRQRRLSYFNADGSEAFCGNGSRCAAWWLHETGATGGKRDFAFETSEGTLRAKITGKQTAAIAMPEPRQIRLGLRLKAAGRALTVHFLDTGVPHSVVEVAGLEDYPVFAVGRALRRHKAFAPAGANADFASFSERPCRVRTYERGVEGETLACGTGVVATALAGFLLGRCRAPVSVRVRGGAIMKVAFKHLGGERFSEVWLEGPARLVFTGEVRL
jgi:diaminopimelate epimerase